MPVVGAGADEDERGNLLATCWYATLGLLLLSVCVLLALGLTGGLPSRPTSDALRLGGFGLAALGVILQASLDYFVGPQRGRMLIRFTRTGWRLGAPAWMVGLLAFAAGSLLA